MNPLETLCKIDENVYFDLFLPFGDPIGSEKMAPGNDLLHIWQYLWYAFKPGFMVTP